MHKTAERLMQQVNENPLLAAGVAVAAINAIAKIVDATSAAQGRRAYAKDVNRRVKKSKMK